MKQSLQLKLGQQLTMTPQLQQAIKLLQLSTLDLQQEIQEALDSNPLLEVAEEDADVPGADKAESETEETTPEADDSALALTEQEETWENKLPDELPVDSQWEDLLPSASAAPSHNGSDLELDQENRDSGTETLREHLEWQLNLTRLSDTDRLIAYALIDATDHQGRLGLDIEDVLESLSPELDIEMDEVVAVLHRLQQFEPAGVCTRDLQECLLVQLKQLSPDTPWLEQAAQVLSRHMAQLGNGDYNQIMRRMRLAESELREVLGLIQTLDPHPGLKIGEQETEYVVPDVFVQKRNDRWVVELNPDIAPRLRINRDYAGLIKRADTSADNAYLRDNLQEARWFLKSLQSRNETLLKVATSIVEHQRNFLEYGEAAMKPLVLHEIAELVDMHESTISRVTNRKYMHTPRGVFELKYFFSSHVGTTTGGEASSTAIRALIKNMVSDENPRKPLSDNKIAQMLEQDEGIKVARRTIAKYRDSLQIPPSNERKRLV
ncbi:MAG: RNA polymerase factor sigma-54 [Pseudomonadota bacterium]